MEIIARSVHLIDYENGTTRTIVPPEAFAEYIADLISHINGNTSIRQFKTTSRRTEVIGSLLDVLEHRADSSIVQSNVNIIANRLLKKEKEAQQRIEHLEVQVQKGSLVQALLLDEVIGNYTYLLAKVEHGGFVDDADFTFKSGFSKDKKTIWKTCIFDLSNTDTGDIPAQIYSNTAARYWWDDFLELTPLIDDTHNTQAAFRAVDSTISRIIKDMAPYDHTIIRNAFVSRFKTSDHIDYDNMVHEVMDSYVPTDLLADKLTALRDRLLELPEKYKFDRQFTAVPSVITAKIKKVYDVYRGIKLQITDEIDHIEDVISAERHPDGTQYIKIKTTESTTFKRFFKKSQ